MLRYCLLLIYGLLIFKKTKSVINISFISPALSINLHVLDVMIVILLKQPDSLTLGLDKKSNMNNNLKASVKRQSECNEKCFVVIDSEQREYQLEIKEEMYVAWANFFYQTNEALYHGYHSLGN